MKTLRYRLTGCPHNLDDCLDLSRTSVPEAASVDLRAERFFLEFYEMVQLVAHCRWQFDGTAVKTQEICGVFFDRDDGPVRRQQLAGANRRLEQMLERMDSLGVRPEGMDRRFGLSYLAVA